MRQAHKLHVASTHSNAPTVPQPLQGSFDASRLERWFLPRKETRLMSEESSRSGLFIPYPMLALLLTLVLALGGGIIGLYSQLSAMQTTLLLRDADYQRQVKELKDEQKLQSMYIADLREKMAAESGRKGK